MNHFFKLLLGTDDLVNYASLLTLALIGVLLSLLLHANTREPNSDRTPIPFIWSFLIADNLKRIVISVILVFASLRFSEQLLGSALNPFIAFMAGVGIDNLAKIIQSKIQQP